MDVNLVREDSINAAFRPRQDNVVDLASRDRSGRRRLVEQLFDEQAAALRLFLKGRLIPDDEIEDLVQELFSRLMGVDGLEAKMSASTGSNRSYLLTMANNMIVDLQRKSAVRKAYSLGQEALESGGVDERTPEQIVAAQMELEATSQIRAIAEESRQIIELRRSKRRATLGIAAGVVLAVGAALLYVAPWSGPDDSHLERHFTRIGEQKTIDLDGGSVVTLNTATQLVVDYSEQYRKILLERGEALFEVAKDPDRPFTVELGVRSVTALGTVFNIRKHPERYHVAVLEGAVSLHPLTEEASASAPPVSTQGESIVIEASTQRRVDEGWVADFEVSGNRMTAFQPESMERYAAWRTGMLRFYREPLYQVVQELNRYTRKKILIEDATVMELSVYVAVSVKELDSALNALEQLLPIKVTKHYDRIVITGSEKKASARNAGS